MADALAYLDAATTGHVVLFDWLLPQSGAAFLTTVEQDAADGPLARHAYVLLTAADINRFLPDEHRLIAACCTEIVTKPFDVLDLLAAVKRAEAQLSW